VNFLIQNNGSVAPRGFIHASRIFAREHLKKSKQLPVATGESFKISVDESASVSVPARNRNGRGESPPMPNNRRPAFRQACTGPRVYRPLRRST
jgi:hypothetical protein